MKPENVKQIRLDKFFNVKFNKKYPIIFYTITSVGIAVGVIFQALNDSVKSGTAEAFSLFYSENPQKSFFGIFASSFSVNALIAAILLFLGFCAVGFAFVYAVPFFSGLGIGAVCGYIYSSYLLKGVMYCAVLIFPTYLIEAFALILACNESVQMSLDILRLIRKNGDSEERIRTDLFLLRYAVIMLISAISSLLYSIGVLLFFRLL